MTSLDTTAEPKSEAEVMTELYRFFAAEGSPNFGCLLYIGISRDALARMRQHHKQSDWMIGAKRMTIEHFPTRAAALQAENEAIRTECPVFNIKHALDEDARIRHYLAREAALKTEIDRLRAELHDARFISREDIAARNYRLTARGVVSLVKRGKCGMWGDGNNLYLRVNRRGGASWTFRYTFDGSGQKQVTLGQQQAMSLSEARDHAFKLKQLLCCGNDPQDDPHFGSRRGRPRKLPNHLTIV